MGILSAALELMPTHLGMMLCISRMKSKMERDPLMILVVCFVPDAFPSIT